MKKHTALLNILSAAHFATVTPVETVCTVPEKEDIYAASASDLFRVRKR